MPVRLKKSSKKPAKPVPPPGRKMSKQEARNYVFKNYAEAMKLLAKH